MAPPRQPRLWYKREPAWVGATPSARQHGRLLMSTAPSPASAPIDAPILPVLAKYWWLVLLRGIAAIIFGILAFIWPGITLLTLILFYGAFALVDGVLALANAIMGGNVGSRWWLALVGVAGIAAGLVTFFMPGLTALWPLFFRARV